MKLYIMIFALVSTTASAQFIASDPIDETNLSLWTAKNIKEYEGIYHLGISEG